MFTPNLPILRNVTKAHLSLRYQRGGVWDVYSQVSLQLTPPALTKIHLIREKNVKITENNPQLR